MWTGIELLYWLQDLRLSNPFLESLSLACSSRVVYLILPIMVAFLFYWCIDKKQGEVIGLGCVSAMVFSMVIKFGIGIPRPWDLDPKIIEVQGAHADGLSCPSGHSAIVTSALGTAAVYSKRRILSILLVLIIVMVVSARLILCVHTPLDIIVGILIGVCSALIAWKAIAYSNKSEKAYWIVTAGYAVFFTALFIIAYLFWGADFAALSEFMGFFYGVIIGRALEHVYAKYEVPKLSLKKHALRYLIGILSSAVILGAFLVADATYGPLIGGLIMMPWAFFVYPVIMMRWKFLN